MFVFHAHWQPPNTPFDPGGILFWAETSKGPPLVRRRRRLSERPRPGIHPYCASLQSLTSIIGRERDQKRVTLWLPTTRTGPLPSPTLAHNWDIDVETPARLAPWKVEGLWLSPANAIGVLVRLPSLATETMQFDLGDDARFWHTVASLVLETLAAQKLVPVIALADLERKIYHARWLPVLDGVKDAPRLAQLEAAMPPLCRAESGTGPNPNAPRALLVSFINTTCDALARQWGRGAQPRFAAHMEDPAYQWIAALFSDDPNIQASQAQLEALQGSHQAWMRNLSIAGDSTFRIAFRLEAPAQQTSATQVNWRLHYLLQARDDPSLFVPAEAVWKTRGTVLNELDRRFEKPQEKLLAGLGYAGRLFPPITENLKSKRPTQLSLDTQGAYTFLREVSPLLQETGFGVLVPPWWNKPGSRLGVRLRLKPSQAGSVDAVPKSAMTLENLIRYRWEISLGDTALTEEEFKALAALKSPLVQIRGQWVQLDLEQIEAAIHFWETQEMEGQIGLLEAMLFGTGAESSQNGLPIDEVIPEGWISEWLERLSKSEKMTQLPQPDELRGELRPYQRHGYSWLYFLRRWRLGACLADDMGLGKTIQTIALLLKEKEIQGSLPAPTLLVCPTSVVTNWERELERFAPTLTTLLHQGPNRLRGEEFIHAAGEVDMVLSSYALVRQDTETMGSISWLGVILDEAQNIKNPSAKQTQSVRKLQADFRLALTGTPVENRLSELWSIMHFLNPGYLGSRKSFRSDFALPIERYGDREATQRLKKIVDPFILRRVKTDPRVIEDLPEKIETKVYCHLTEEQATLYQAVVEDAMQQVEASEGIQRRGHVLSMMMQLKQICNHPVQYLHQADKKTHSQEDLAGRSGKLERLAEMLDEIMAQGERALIFTQFAEMGQLLSGYLPSALGYGTVFLHGGVPAKSRDQLVRRFQEDPRGPPVFILSLKAGGTGLNLTRANHVFHFDRWWNPAVEDQATDRAFRIGQKRNVQVHKFLTVGTMEEMIDEMIENKKGLAQSVVGSGEGWLTELDTQELRELVRLRR
jgi:SNF2 family DNA or RNA helicase